MEMFKDKGSGVRGQGSGVRVKNPPFHFRFSICDLRFSNPQSAIRNPQLVAGFTIVELIIIIVIVGILAASIGYRFYSTADTASIVGVDQVVADIQYVQVKAMGDISLAANQRSISFTNGSGTYTVAGETKTLSGGATAGNTITFTFNSLGEPVAGGDQTLTISTKTIKVWGITGKVEEL